ncbi:MAG TPA: GNAT family N-acetyltransferase [Pyrinomonadaceae bacterium]|nr:GNAT family N-acetyltransferase [Pyrinomonadaceae bacterium]
METVKTRLATAADAETLARIGWKSFDDAFADHPANHPDDMKVYMNEAFAPATISADLQEPDTIYLIAEIESEAVGYAKIKFDSREEFIEGDKTLELCRLYALDEFIGKGIGKVLMLRLFEIAGERNCDVVWLGVWEFNFRAQEFYKKFGFEKCGEHVFQLGNDPQIDWVMQRKVR